MAVRLHNLQEPSSAMKEHFLSILDSVDEMILVLNEDGHITYVATSLNYEEIIGSNWLDWIGLDWIGLDWIAPE